MLVSESGAEAPVPMSPPWSTGQAGEGQPPHASVGTFVSDILPVPSAPWCLWAVSWVHINCTLSAQPLTSYSAYSLSSKSFLLELGIKGGARSWVAVVCSLSAPSLKPSITLTHSFTKRNTSFSTFYFKKSLLLLCVCVCHEYM